MLILDRLRLSRPRRPRPLGLRWISDLWRLRDSAPAGAGDDQAAELLKGF